MGYTILYAGIVLLGLFLGFAGMGAILFSWALVPRTYSLESRVTELEQDVIREVKRRGAIERWNKPKAEDEVLDQIKTSAKSVQPAPAWYDAYVNPELKR